MTLSDKQLAELARTIADTAAVEIDCDELLARAAAYLEAIAADPDAIPAEFESVAQHLRICPECREEIDLLLETHRRQRDA